MYEIVTLCHVIIIYLSHLLTDLVFRVSFVTNICLSCCILMFALWCVVCCFRVKELIDNGMHRFVMDPDRETTLRILQDHVTSLRSVAPPAINNWTDSLDCIPQKYCYLSVVERTVAVLDSVGNILPVPLALPVADKPLVKGFNFFASGNVGEILVNDNGLVIHIRTGVLASMREVRYDVKCAIDNQTGLVVLASCECPAGAGGKCNHVSSVLFALLDFVTIMRNLSCCTNQPQTWHRRRGSGSEPLNR